MSQNCRSVQAMRCTKGSSALLALLLGVPAFAEILAVPAQYATIQAAIDASSDGDTIKIDAGTYQVSAPIDTKGKAITLLGVVDIEGNRPILDGDGTTRVFELTSGEDEGTVFENLVIERGSTNTDGAGMFISNGSPTLVSCEFRHNWAGGHGGGLHLESTGIQESRPTLMNCVFWHNGASRGGGLHGVASSPVLDRCEFKNNIAGSSADNPNGSGGGLRLDGGHPTLTNCVFSENDAFSGGGMYNDVDGQLVLSDCEFKGNTASWSGGGIYNNCTYGVTIIERGVFKNNFASSSGGGLWSRSSVNGGIQVADCTFRENSAVTEGGGMFFSTYNECNNATMLLLNDTQLGDVAASDTILVRVGVSSDGGFGLGSLKIAMVPRISALHSLVFKDEESGSIGSPVEIGDLGESTVIVPLRIEFGGDHWYISCNDDIVDDPIDEDYEVTIDEDPRGMWLEITIPDDFDSQRQVLAVGSCTPESLSDIFIAAYKRIGEVDGQETYQRFAYVSDSDNFGCSNAGQYPNNMKSCLGSYILVNDSGTYTDPNGDGPIIADNVSALNGGGICSFDCDIEVFGCSFERNRGTWGGGIYSKHINYAVALPEEQWLVALPFPKLVGCTFTGNVAGDEDSAGKGGGFYGESQWALYMADCAFDANQVIGPDGISGSIAGGGGLFATGSTLRLANCAFTNNEAMTAYSKVGGGLCNVGSSGLTMENSVFEGNRANRRGGGLYNEGKGLTTLTDCTFSANQAQGTSNGDGGGMYSSVSGTQKLPGRVMLENCEFLGNQAIGSFAEGGGLYSRTGNDSDLMATGCLFTENSAEHEGGGLYNDSNALTSVVLADSQLCANTPDQIEGVWTDNGCNTVAVTCLTPCPADFDGDGVVGVNDLLAFLPAYGTIPGDGDCGVGFDLDQDGFIGVNDLLMFLEAYGQMCDGRAPRTIDTEGGELEGRPGSSTDG